MSTVKLNETGAKVTIERYIIKKVVKDGGIEHRLLSNSAMLSLT